MEAKRTRGPGVLGVIASGLGLFFSAFSTHDYAQHLDRQLHSTHCSFVPGLTDATAGANACTAAMYSPYSAILRDRYWGGVPISLAALGVYAFFLALAVYLLTAGLGGSKRAWQGYGLAALTPIVASAVMFTISLTQLGAFCKLCVGLYISSALLFASGVWALRVAGGKLVVNAEDTVPDPVPPFAVPPGYPPHAYAVPTAEEGANSPIPTGGFAVIPALFLALGVFAVLPELVYVGALPDFAPYLGGCGKLTEVTEKHNALVRLPTQKPVQPALLLVDPLCPTCKAFHDRLITENIFEKLDVTVAVFPLDNECNWMLDRAMHPGACILAKAVLCGDKAGNRSREILEWSYANQEELTGLGKAGKDPLRAKVKARFPEVDACIDSKETKQRLEQILQFAVTNKLTLSTPQFYLGDTRVCDEDTDLGLRFTVGQLAPQVNAP
jgi:uncharacterized membrane protein